MTFHEAPVEREIVLSMLNTPGRGRQYKYR